ncbi:glycosyltransferase family 4 protein [Longispora sp. NPDC051575]|uniref:glycosyltransferase family 4 protein n=1 Tax=Longispora sp. NPDC051575 TaxID=3154943 RepID=UPI00341647EF
MFTDDAQPPAPLTADFRRPGLLVVASEWFSAHGGLSTLNRDLCVGLAAADASVVCLVPHAAKEEREHAALHGVTLISARPAPGVSARQTLARRPALPPGVTIDAVLGHGRVTGPEARILTEDHFPSAVRLQLVHIAPDELECWRSDRSDDLGQRSEARTRLELELGVDAARVIAVGPRLHELLCRDLSVYPGVPRPARLDPGFDLPTHLPRVPPPGGPSQILLMGRLEDYEIKGVDLAARALSYALKLRGGDEPEVELLVRGAPPGESARLRDRILGWAPVTGLRVTPRPFTTDAEHLRQDLLRASLVLMPSRAEGFGLVGAEAITAGAPTLVSGRSGLGSLLHEILPADEARRVVVPVRLRPVEDIQRWGHHIAAVLNDPAAAFATAAAVRRRAAAKRTWSMAAHEILRVIRESGRSREAAPDDADGRLA